MSFGKHYCDECIWNDVCDENSPCEDMVLQDSEQELNEFIETERFLFRQEWYEYEENEQG